VNKDIASDALMAGLTTAKDVPYFDGDFWPNTLEEAIAEEEKEKDIEVLMDTGDGEIEVVPALSSFYLTFRFTFFTARCSAEHGCAMVSLPSVCL